MSKSHVDSISIEDIPSTATGGLHGQLCSVSVDSDVIGSEFKARHFEQGVLGTNTLNVPLENTVFHAHPTRALQGKPDLGLKEMAGFHKVGGLIAQRQMPNRMVRESGIHPSDLIVPESRGCTVESGVFQTVFPTRLAQ